MYESHLQMDEEPFQTDDGFGVAFGHTSTAFGSDAIAIGNNAISFTGFNPKSYSEPTCREDSCKCSCHIFGDPQGACCGRTKIKPTTEAAYDKATPRVYVDDVLAEKKATKKPDPYLWFPLRDSGWDESEHDRHWFWDEITYFVIALMFLAGSISGLLSWWLL